MLFLILGKHIRILASNQIFDSIGLMGYPLDLFSVWRVSCALIFSFRFVSCFNVILLPAKADPQPIPGNRGEISRRYDNPSRPAYPWLGMFRYFFRRNFFPLKARPARAHQSGFMI